MQPSFPFPIFKELLFPLPSGILYGIDMSFHCNHCPRSFPTSRACSMHGSFCREIISSPARPVDGLQSSASTPTRSPMSPFVPQNLNFDSPDNQDLSNDSRVLPFFPANDDDDNDDSSSETTDGSSIETDSHCVTEFTEFTDSSGIDDDDSILNLFSVDDFDQVSFLSGATEDPKQKKLRSLGDVCL